MQKSAAYWEGYNSALEKVSVSLKWVQKVLGPKNIARFKYPTGKANDEGLLDALDVVEKMERKYPRIAKTLLYGETPVTPVLEHRRFEQLTDKARRIFGEFRGGL